MDERITQGAVTPSRHERIVAGIPMRWAEQGAGTPVVLVHGIPTGPALWRHVMPRVEGARLLAWEMVGYAGSIAEGREREIGVARQAEYLRGWLDAMGLERVVLAGHDLGGGVAHILAVRHPERCAGLLLTNCVGYDSWPIPSVKMLRALGGLVRWLPDGAVKQGIFQMLMRLGHDDPRVASESLEVHWAHYAASADGAGDALIRQMRALDVHDTLDVAPRLTAFCAACRRAWSGGSPTTSRRSSTASGSRGISACRWSTSKAANTSRLRITPTESRRR